MLKAPRRRAPFWFYVAAEEKVIGAILTQETKGKEHVITYVSQHFVDAEIRYAFIEKLSLLLYYIIHVRS